MKIENTNRDARHPWPPSVYVQGGERGTVFRRNAPPYTTAFVEAFPVHPYTMLRGEGADLAAAEDDAWAKYQRLLACPTHPRHGPFEAREYRNGSGYCTRCGCWFSGVLAEQLPTEANPA